MKRIEAGDTLLRNLVRDDPEPELAVVVHQDGLRAAHHRDVDFTRGLRTDQLGRLWPDRVEIAPTEIVGDHQYSDFTVRQIRRFLWSWPAPEDIVRHQLWTCMQEPPNMGGNFIATQTPSCSPN
jgi:hypothetical protein